MKCPEISKKFQEAEEGLRLFQKALEGSIGF
jgi:hypothetical protein